MAYPLMATVMPSRIEAAACSAVEMRFFRLLSPILSFKAFSRFLSESSARREAEKEFLVGRLEAGDLADDPGVIHVVLERNVLRYAIASPRSTAQRVGEWHSADPATAICSSLRLVDDHTSGIGFQCQFLYVLRCCREDSA